MISEEINMTNKLVMKIFNIVRRYQSYGSGNEASHCAMEIVHFLKEENDKPESRESLLKEEVERLKKENEQLKDRKEFFRKEAENEFQLGRNKIHELEQKNKELGMALITRDGNLTSKLLMEQNKALRDLLSTAIPIIDPRMERMKKQLTLKAEKLLKQ